MNENEIKGQIDLTIVPIHVRVAAGVGVANLTEGSRQATGVIVALEVEFPVAIPLANSGLGIYGFLGRSRCITRGKNRPPQRWRPRWSG